ncbi:hypothetical protein F8M41_013282 [Gigaspora margarita]|uniref:Uncharacterized protein n=1 Tax=Gigaspora margarita TaxID=4874 RepID=A0A8H3WWW2_GIGMA|nr:hypothetical protein F8M41_013282 [Gigaspora margarita]
MRSLTLLLIIINIMIFIISSTEHGPNGSKFDATKISTENGSHNKTDQASVEAKNKNGEFSTSKSSVNKKEFTPQKIRMEAKSMQITMEIILMQVKTPVDLMHRFKALQAVLVPQKVKMEANSLQIKAPLKSSSVNGIQSQGHTSNVDASKGKGGSKYDANESSYELDAYRQNSLSSVSAKDSHGNQFDANKNTNEIGRHNQASSSSPMKTRYTEMHV